MDIVLLCAGTSSRMGRTNKMLLPYNNMTIVANSAMQALTYLSKQKETSTLIIVTGYQHTKVEKALKPCMRFIEQTDANLNMIVVYNKNYKQGQFTSVQTGIKQVADNKPFFITLADLPLIQPEHYAKLETKPENYDAVRPLVDNIPGHPVLLAPHMKQIILKARKNNKVGTILSKYNLKTIKSTDPAYITDIDTPESFKQITNQ